MNEMVAMFKEEADELFSSAENLCLKAEKEGSLSDDDMGALFRDIHTLKGSGASVDLISFPKYVHDFETFMDKLRKKELTYEPHMADDLLTGLDIMQQVFDEEAANGVLDDNSFYKLTLESINVIKGYLGEVPVEYNVIDDTSTVQVVTGEEEAPKEAKKIDNSNASIRVNLDKIDKLMNGVGNLVIVNAMLAQLAEEVQEKELSSLFQEKMLLLEREVRSLQDGVMNVRMVPMEIIYNKFPPMIRDVSKKLNKTIDFQHSGDSVEIDKATIEGLTDPLMHIVRNSLDHGIEAPQDRISKGKPEAGLISLGAETSNGMIIITIVDDGNGINGDKVADKAIKNGLITQEEANNMTFNEKAELVFSPGLSTAEEITDISGRGVGMDVVKTNITSLGGKITLDTKLGEGTTLIISLPLTLAILDGLNIQVGTSTYVMPLNVLTETLQVTPKMIKKIGAGNQEFLKYRDNYIPIVRLYEEFAVDDGIEDIEKGIMLIVSNQGNTLAVFVDKFANQQQFVVKPMDKNFIQVPGFSGATIKGDGSISLILEPFELISNNHNINNEEDGE